MSVIAIPPSYNEDQSLETKSTVRYLQFLYDNGATKVMTTAGTSQFNLLTIDEVHEFNAAVTAFNGEKILGVPALSTREAIQFIRDAEFYSDNRTQYMLLYPDRYYSDESIKKYVTDITSATNRQVYLHAQKARHGVKGSWEYSYKVINSLSDNLLGIKEEISDLKESYDFVANILFHLDIIVAGGSMRRFHYLEMANPSITFLSGIGNINPRLEKEFANINIGKHVFLEKERSLFDVFMKYGWHRSLRYALKYYELTCFNNRDPWPQEDAVFTKEVADILMEQIGVEGLDFGSVFN